MKLRFREEKAQFVDLDDFDIEAIPSMSDMSQSITLGSKMNHDGMWYMGERYDQEADLLNEPPFI